MIGYRMKSVARVQCNPNTLAVEEVPDTVPGIEEEEAIATAATDALELLPIAVMVSDNMTCSCPVRHPRAVRIDFALWPHHWPTLARREAAIQLAVSMVVGPGVEVTVSRVSLKMALRWWIARPR